MSTMPSLAPLPDAERLVSAYLREHARIVALVADRVYTTYPAKAGPEPLLLVQRVGGDVPFSQPLVIERVQLQFDAYGGPKRAAYDLAATTRAVLTELEGAVRPEGNVGGVLFGTFQWLPDETFSPPRPRYVFDTTMAMRAPATGAVRSASVAPDADEHRLPVGASVSQSGK